MSKKKILLSDIKKRIERIKNCSYDAVSANKLNKKDLSKFEKSLIRIRNEFVSFDDSHEEQNNIEIQTLEEFQKKVKIHKKLTLKKKRDSKTFKKWLFNNNEL